MAYYLTEKKDGYFKLSSAEQVNCYLIEGSEKALLIDTGYGLGDLKETVCRITQKPLVILNTHGHCDHVGGNAQFSGPCYIPAKEMDLCKRHTARKMRKDNAERIRNSINFVTGEPVNGLPENFDMEKYLSMGTGNLEEITEGSTIDLGGITFTILETPGHTGGGISVFWQEKNIIFTGDAVGPFTWMFLDESTALSVYKETIQKLYDLNADAYIGGHAPEPMKREQLLLFMEASDQADYEKGIPFSSFLDQQNDPRVCIANGMTFADVGKPDFAAIVIGKNTK